MRIRAKEIRRARHRHEQRVKAALKASGATTAKTAPKPARPTSARPVRERRTEAPAATAEK